MSDAWYRPADEYYVDEHELPGRPMRQGDVFAAPEGESEWKACQLLHPTCDLLKTSVRALQVIRVHELDEVAVPQRAAVTVGWDEKDGAIRVAFAHTYFLPPVPRHNAESPLFADFRDVRLIPRASMGDRLAALTHEARVTFIRRHMYFQYRLPFSYEDVRAWEGARIATDTTFVGARPPWAIDAP